MAIAEILVTTIGTSVAKGLFEGWLKDKIIDGSTEGGALGISSTLFKLVEKKTGDFFTARNAKTQFEQIADSVAQDLSPIIEANSLDEASKLAVIKAVGDAIREYNAESLFSAGLSPSELAQNFIQAKPYLLTGFSESEISLFDRLLIESASLLVNLGSNLKGFDIEAFKRFISTQGDLLKLVREILDGQKRMNLASQDPEQKFAEFENEYRYEITANLNRMDHLGLSSLSEELAQVPLDVAYVSLKAKGRRHKGRSKDEEQQDSAFDELFESELSIEEILTNTKYILIRGAAGCGKTTLLRWLAVQIAGGKLQDDTLQYWQNKLPFYIRLRDYSEHLPDPENFLDFAARNIKGKMPQGWVHHHLGKAWSWNHFDRWRG